MLQQATLQSSQGAGTEGAMPAGDVLRPGGSVGLLAGMLVETYSEEHGRRPEVRTQARDSFTLQALQSMPSGEVLRDCFRRDSY